MSYGDEAEYDAGTARDVEVKLAMKARQARQARPEPSTIAEELGALDEAQEDLQGALHRLFDRIGPVLRPEEPEKTSGDVRGIRIASDVRQMIERHTEHARRMRCAVDAVIERVDL